MHKSGTNLVPLFAVFENACGMIGPKTINTSQEAPKMNLSDAIAFYLPSDEDM